MEAAIVALAAVFGLLIGSFLNVVIYRVPLGESVVKPGSHCPRCDTPIKPWQNIPVLSYLALRGRCAHCREPISSRYPLVELATGALFALVTWWALTQDYPHVLPVLLYLAAIGIALAMIDIDVHRLPNAIVLPAYPVVIAGLVAASAWSGDWGALARAGIGLASLYLFYLISAFLYPRGMGMGDVKLSGVLGAILGYIGFPALLFGAFAAFLLGTIGGGIMLLVRSDKGSRHIPFGPYMLLGAAVGIWAGPWLGNAYWSLLGV